MLNYYRPAALRPGWKDLTIIVRKWKIFETATKYFSTFSLTSWGEGSDCDLYRAGDVCDILRHPLPNV